MRPEQQRRTKPQTGIARARMVFKQSLPWLPGYPLGIESDAIAWQSIVWSGTGAEFLHPELFSQVRGLAQRLRNDELALLQFQARFLQTVDSRPAIQRPKKFWKRELSAVRFCGDPRTVIVQRLVAAMTSIHHVSDPLLGKWDAIAARLSQFQATLEPRQRDALAKRLANLQRWMTELPAVKPPLDGCSDKYLQNN